MNELTAKEIDALIRAGYVRVVYVEGRQYFEPTEKGLEALNAKLNGDPRP